MITSTSGSTGIDPFVARIARRLRQAVDAELRAYGLTDATWRPLAYVGKLGGGVRQKELATALSIEGRHWSACSTISSAAA